MLKKIKAPADFFMYADDSAEFFYVGASEFADWSRYCQPSGPEALVRPNLIERQAIRKQYGFNRPIVNRVFRYANPANPFGIMPGLVNPANDYSKANAFMDLCAEFDVYVDWTCGDSEAVLPSTSDQQNDLNNFCANLQRPCFVETCNEPFQNGELPQHGVVPPPSEWYLRDSGNYVFINDRQRWEYQYDLDFISFHGDRTNAPSRWPKWVCDLDDSIATLRTVVGRATVLKEPTKFIVNPAPYQYDDPAYAKCLGLRANMGGVVFHYQKGLEGNGFDGPSRTAYGEFFRGAAAALG